MRTLETSPSENCVLPASTQGLYAASFRTGDCGGRLVIAPNDMAAPEALLPDRRTATHHQHRLEHREEESCDTQARRRKGAARTAVTTKKIMREPSAIRRRTTGAEKPGCG